MFLSITLCKFGSLVILSCLHRNEEVWSLNYVFHLQKHTHSTVINAKPYKKQINNETAG